MAQNKNKYRNVILSALVVMGIIGCSSTPDEKSDEMAATESTASTDAAVTDATASTEVKKEEMALDPSTSVVGKAVEKEESVENVPEMVEPLRMVASCKKEPYIKYEKKSRKSIKKGWEAKKAEKYGVGFRNAKEYKKWSSTHNTIFKKVAGACETLSKCTKKHKKDKKKKCSVQATAFRDWQAAAKTFSNKVKVVAKSQVDKLCSLKPSLSDPGRCFAELAGNVKKVCKSEECDELKLCWESISFMDGALRQAETACRFARQKLSKCRGYSEQTSRRKAQLERCGAMQEKLNINVLPAI